MSAKAFSKKMRFFYFGALYLMFHSVGFGRLLASTYPRTYLLLVMIATFLSVALLQGDQMGL
jgi:hypothetical protein